MIGYSDNAFLISVNKNMVISSSDFINTMIYDWTDREKNIF